MEDNRNAGGSAVLIHKSLLQSGNVLQHKITCVGRNHLITRRSEEQIVDGRQRAVGAEFPR